MAARELALHSRCHGGLDSSFAGLGAARGWRWSGRFVASACATMLVAAGVSFSGSENARQELSAPTQSLWGTAATAATAAAAADALGRVAGMIKKAVYRSSGRRVHGDDEKIPPSRLLLRICRSTYSGRGRHLPSAQYRARSAPPAPALRCGSACRTHLGRRIATGTRQVRATRTRASVRPLAEHLAPRCQDSGPLKIR